MLKYNFVGLRSKQVPIYYYPGLFFLWLLSRFLERIVANMWNSAFTQVTSSYKAFPRGSNSSENIKFSCGWFCAAIYARIPSFKKFQTLDLPTHEFLEIQNCTPAD